MTRYRPPYGAGGDPLTLRIIRTPHDLTKDQNSGIVIHISGSHPLNRREHIMFKASDMFETTLMENGTVIGKSVESMATIMRDMHNTGHGALTLALQTQGTVSFSSGPYTFKAEPLNA